MIQKPFVMEGVDEEDIQLMKSFHIWHKQNPEDSTQVTVIQQKVTLEHENMEKFMDIMQDCCKELFSLLRYENQRYELVFHPEGDPIFTRNHT